MSPSGTPPSSRPADLYYGLDGHRVVVIEDVHEWAKMFEKSAERIVAQTTVGDSQVSTVFLGIDHNWAPEGPPLLFETMCFGGPLAESQWRYSSWEEAEAGHAHAVKLVERAFRRVAKARAQIAALRRELLLADGDD